MSDIIRVALVTGSGSGIGENIAVDLVQSGYLVILTGRNQENLDKVLARCNQLSNKCKTSAIAYKLDLNDLKQVDALIEFIRSKFDRLDLLVNNACYRGTNRGMLSEEAFIDIEKVLHMNLMIPTYLINKCLMPMRPKNNARAVVVNMSSVASRVVVPLNLYSISKACLTELSRQLSKTSGQDQVDYITIAPGPVLTDERQFHKDMAHLTLLNSVASTQNISDLVMYAIKNARLLNGQEIIIDGGYSVVQYPRITNS